MSVTNEIAAPADPDLEPGTMVGEYEVQDKLGQGAFGTVFRAVHPLIGKVVAIKVLGQRFSVDPEMVERFVAEARAVNQIRNRHIIDIFSFDKLADGRLYYVMEYLDGEPLDALIDRHHRIPIGDALSILRGIAKALDAAHAKGVAHRDLKAENVFLATDPDGGVWPKLLDFGIAKLLGPEEGLKHKTRTGAPIGTPYYMSPEQCRGKDVDHRTDIYAFGVLAYLMLTGVYPFDGDDYMSILIKQISDAPPPPSSHAPELPPEVDAAILTLMDKDPALRPDSLRAAVRSLHEAASAAGLVTATPTGVWDVQSGPVAQVAHPTQPPNVGVARGTHPTTEPAPLDTLAPAAAPGRRRWWIAAAAAVVVVGAVGFVVATRGGDGDRSTGAASGSAAATTPAPAPVPAPVPTPAPTPTPDPTPQLPAQSQTVIVTITGVPEGTEVLAGGMTVGAAPGPVQLPRDTTTMLLTFKAEGYLMASRSITPTEDQALAVTLKRRRIGVGGGGKKRGTRDDILDPFGGKQR